MRGYATAQEHLLDELRRVDLLLFCQVQKSRRERHSQENDEFRGLYISEAEIDELFEPQGPLEPDAKTRSYSEIIVQIEQAIETKSAEIGKRKELATTNGVSLPLCGLQSLFDLNHVDIEMLLMALAPELNLKYERIFGYLQDNVTKKRPTVDLLLSLLGTSFERKASLRARFRPSAPLLGNGLVELHDEPGTHGVPLLAKYVKVDEVITDFLLGEEPVDSIAAPYLEWKAPEAVVEHLHIPPEELDRLAALAQAFTEHDREADGAFTVFFSGPYGSGKRLAAETICQQAGLGLLILGMRELLSADLDPRDMIRRVFRLARLRNAVLYCANAEVLFATNEQSRRWKRALFDAVRSGNRGLLIGSDISVGEGVTFEGLPVVRVDLSPPSYELRKKLWKKCLGAIDAEVGASDLAALASRFRLTGGEISEIVGTAKRNTMPDEKGTIVSTEALFDACRIHSRHRLVDLAVKVAPRRGWEDIVLPQDRVDILREICTCVKHQALVLDEWGFGEKLALSKGLNILFAGPSGTGKSMGAEIIAGELGLDLYRIDLATVVSKYIGETEKNLDRIFREAEHSNAILFFDEADAIFGKRSEIRDSHDRYANIEISYLLQKMESYDGIAILATNLRKNLDEAFLRRMDFTVEYPMPEEPDRLKIWQLSFPERAPLSDDVDLAFLARQFKISGGNIKNIAVAAAFHAAERGGPITMASLVHGTKREFQKIGKLVVDVDFAEFRHLLSPSMRS